MSKQENAGRLKTDPSPPMEELEISGAVYTTWLTSKFRNRIPWVRPDLRKILAVIPGTIQKVMVSEGDVVSAGDSMMILEAMKMRNEIRATYPGVIKRIHVKEGDQVPKSHLLLEFQ
jgi:biotin carboxyl carrier protein